MIEPRANHLLFLLAEMNAALVVDQLAQELEIGIGNLHGEIRRRALGCFIGVADTILRRLK
jgi:hypothetical protein